jgi:hypothetical protein
LNGWGATDRLTYPENKMNSRISVALALALGAAACSSSDGMTGDPVVGGPTYAADIAPLLNDKCTKCHQAGGIGPFALTSYADVNSKAALVAAMTRTRTMPPYLMTHDGSCGNFEDGDALSDAQIDLIQRWANGGRAEGGSVTLTPPQIPTLEGGTEYKTPEIVPVAQGGMLAVSDDYRCFALDTNLPANRYITGYDVAPGRPEIVHHVVAFIIDPNRMTKMGKTNAQLMQELDAQDDRVGWECFGQAGDGIEEESTPLVWAPGQGLVNYPAGMGVLQRPTDKLVVQLHYNLADPATKGLSDSSKVRFRYVEKVDRPLMFMLPDGLLNSLFDPNRTPDSLRAGLPKVSYTWAMPLTQFLPPETKLDVVAVMPHMHQRGKAIEMRFVDSAGNKTCQARIDAWNFHWQKYYFYKGAVPTLDTSSTIEATCDYDTSQDHADVLPGWGTRNEMCLESLIVAPRK